MSNPPDIQEYTQLDDSTLVSACLNGDEQAWGTLLERYNRLIYTIPLRFGFTKAIADEIHQETCLIMLEKLDTLQDRSQLRSWLMTVTRRACIKRWRAKGVEEVELMDTEQARHATIEENMGRLEEQFLIQEAFTQISGRCQQLLQSLFLTDPPLTYDEISEELGISLGSIGPTRSRCLDKLRREVERLQR